MLGSEVLQPYQRKQIQFNDLVRGVCKEYRLKEEDLVSTSRNRYSPKARQIFGWLALKTDNITFSNVVQHFGRDVTTLSRGVKRMEKKTEKTRIFAKKIDELYNSIIQA
jgi:chromosomal replication initiation ATPase DnaA